MMRELVILLLRQLDRHPVRALSACTVQHAIHLVDDLRRRGILRYRPPLDEGDLMTAELADDEEVELRVEGEVCSDERTLDIDVRALALEIRRCSGLGGSALEVLNSKVIRLGSLPARPYPCTFYLVRLLDDRTALDIALSVKGRNGDGRVVLVSPTSRELRPDIMRRLAAEGIELVSAEDRVACAEGLHLQLALHDLVEPTTDQVPADALEIDKHAQRAFFHGHELRLEPRDYRVLARLAAEVDAGGAPVPNEDLLAALAGSDDPNRQPQEEQVASSVTWLRKVLCAAGGYPATDGKVLLRNQPGRGYLLSPPGQRIWVRH
jgi:DNA-binding response OmpR family regulator